MPDVRRNRRQETGNSDRQQETAGASDCRLPVSCLLSPVLPERHGRRGCVLAARITKERIED